MTFIPKGHSNPLELGGKREFLSLKEFLFFFFTFIPYACILFLKNSALISYVVIFPTARSSKASPISSAVVRCDSEVHGPVSHGPPKE